jgi:translation initiation factor IF-2
MNNSKVRIYDLSKELNLENRDILAICEDLEIAVKSHSSTISESEAGKIRAAAEKFSPRPAVVAKKAPTTERVERQAPPPPKVSNVAILLAHPNPKV